MSHEMRALLVILLILLTVGCYSVSYSINSTNVGKSRGCYAIRIAECPDGIDKEELYAQLAKRMGSRLQRLEHEYSWDIPEGDEPLVRVTLKVKHREVFRDWSSLTIIGLCYLFPYCGITDHLFDVIVMDGNVSAESQASLRETLSFCMQPMGYLPIAWNDEYSLSTERSAWYDLPAVKTVLLNEIASAVDVALSKLREESGD